MFCSEERRVVSRDYVLQFENLLFQIQRQIKRLLPAPRNMCSSAEVA